MALGQAGSGGKAEMGERERIGTQRQHNRVSLVSQG